VVELIITFFIVGAAAVYDYRTRRIPNLLTFPALALGLVINIYYSGFKGLEESLLGLLLGGLLLLIPFVLGGMGAGDVKLLAAVGALNGPHFVLFTFIYGAIAGGVMALLVLLLRGRFAVVINNLVLTLVVPGQGLAKSNLGIPYGIAIFIGTLAAWYMGVS
jgi:prepilin peptidase CpaA